MSNEACHTLVVGGAGYIGSHTALALQKEGVPYATLDNLERGHAEFVVGELLEADLRDPAALREVFQGRTFTDIYHFAAYAYVGESEERPADYFRNNVIGTYHLLERAVEHGLKRFVFSSTCSTYGNPGADTIDESHPQRPINTYAQTKLAVEQMLEAFRRQHGLGYTILRYFNAAGADPDGAIGEWHEPETHLIPLAIRAALGEGELRVFGDDYPTPDGTCVRDYVHVTDLADAHVRAMRATSPGEAAVYNLGTGRGHSVLEVISTVRAITGAEPPYRVVERRPGDPAKLVACADKARAELAWKTEYNLDRIIETAYQWHQRHPRTLV